MRPSPASLLQQPADIVPRSLQRILEAVDPGERRWIGPDTAVALATEEREAYDLAHNILCHLCIQAPLKNASGHPGGPLSSFTFAYLLARHRNPAQDQPLRYSAGHLSLLAYSLQWFFGREGDDPRLQGPEAIMEHFRRPNGLPGHVEADIGDIPFGTGPLGKGVSNALGAAFGLKLQKQPGIADVLMADGDSQEGQIAEAFRLASHLRLNNLVVHGDFNDVQLSGLPSKTMAADVASIAHAQGWNVIEVQNGNDPAQVQAALLQADEWTGGGRPTFICYYTVMGHGVALMEKGSNDDTKNFHGAPLTQAEADEALALLPPLPELIAAYEPYRQRERVRFLSAMPTATNLPLSFDVEQAAKRGYARSITVEKGAARKDLGAVHLKTLMEADARIVVLHADLAGSGGFDAAEKAFPERVINVGVAEANMVMMAAGMRQTGLLPVTYTFAAFGTNEARASARLIDINCAHTRCGVFHDCTHAGLSVGEDGETHQEQNYLTLPFRHTQVWMPADSNQAAAMAEAGMELIAEGHQSVYLFSPRSNHPQIVRSDGSAFYGPDYRFEGKADVIAGQGDASDRITILATGITVHSALEAARLLAAEEHPVQVRVVNVACIRPIDSAAILKAALETGRLVTVEDHNTEGGLATQVADIIADFQLPCSLRRLGLNHYFPSAKAEELFFFAGIDAESIVQAAHDELRTEITGGEDAFVSAIFSFLHNLRHSRFADTARPFLERLVEDDTYLASLRAFWASRSVPPEKLPDNARLKSMLDKTVQAIRTDTQV